MADHSPQSKKFPSLSQNDVDVEKQVQRSREKRPPQLKLSEDAYVRKIQQREKNSEGTLGNRFQNRFKSSNNQREELYDEKDQNDFKSQLLRSFLRIEQDREQPIDKFVKIAWAYKGYNFYDRSLNEIMKDPSKFIEKLTSQQLEKTAQLAKGHAQMENMADSKMQIFWTSLIQLIKLKLTKKNSTEPQQNQRQYQQKIAGIIAKPLQELVKLEKQIKMILKSQSYGANNDYWKHVLEQIKIKKCEGKLFEFYKTFKQQNEDKILNEENKVQQDILEQPTSPTLVPYTSVNPKLLVKDEVQKEKRQKLAQKIFTQQFQKGRQKLEINLSLPHNHGLLSTQIITEQNVTYDQITKQIIEFEKYKRMEEDEEQFNDWVPCETEGRFRDRKPVYLNRVRITHEVMRYGCVHRYTEDNPPPKSIQGYKFNIFYPDLYDKQKTPQYYLSNTDDPNYCIITFKAGPPYKDIAFKILKKEWEFTQKSGFQSIFSRGILHLYFNFKMPRFRI